MKYKNVRITPENGHWIISVNTDNSDRVDRETKPSPLGYFYFPESVPESEAVLSLLECMIGKHSEELERLANSLNELQKLKDKVSE